MNDDSIAAIIVNDLDSLIHRIEALPANQGYTEALTHVVAARNSVIAGRAEIHQTVMRERYRDPPG